jgi:hypothetical protein
VHRSYFKMLNEYWMLWQLSTTPHERLSLH